SNDGILSTSFTPSGVTGNTTFQFDQNAYVLEGTALSYDSNGNLTEQTNRSKQVRIIAMGYNGSLPIVKANGARINEMKYSDFDVGTSLDNSVSWPASYGTGLGGTKSLVFPPGNTIPNGFTN